ncbi:MAG: fimbrillin family protein [Rikenellaceae bacterium]
MKKILYILSAMLFLASCTTETLEVPTSSDSCVNFTTENSITRATEDKSSWVAGDLIGITATDSSGAVQNSNVSYKATSSGTTTSFGVATSGDEICYPSSSGNLTFYAYYPYSESVTGEKIPIDLATSQSDLLVSKPVSNNQATGGDVNLEFSHALTLVQITLSTSDEISSLEGLTGYIADSYTAGSYDLLTSSLSVDTEQGKIELDVVVSEDKTSATVTALVMPNEYTSGVAIYFEIGDHIYYDVLQPVWGAAYKYSYTAKVGSDNLTLEPVDIAAWEDEETSSPGTTLVDIYYNRGDDKFYINSAKGLAAFRDIVNGNIVTNTTDALFWGFDGDLFKQANLDIDGVLTTDIDLSNLGTGDWTPIGYWDSEDYLYAGTFDGGGHRISGLSINNTANQRGLFRYIDTDGEVRNLGVSGSVSCTAAFTSDNEPANYEIGAITPLNRGFIINCYSLVDVYGTITKVGGIAGYNVGSIVNCYNHGKVEGATNVGGIVGYNCDGGYVGYCYSIGEVSAIEFADYSGDTRVGGVVGYNITTTDEDPTIKGSFCLNNTQYSIGQVKVKEDSGGITGNVCTEEYLTSDEFATIINNGSYTFNSSKYSPIPACAWVDNSVNYSSADGADNSSAYPTLNFGVLPEYDGIYDIIYNSGIYEIYSGKGLQTFAALVNGSTLPEYIVTKGGNDYFIDKVGIAQPTIAGQLMNNIDLKDVCGVGIDSDGGDVNWTPIGNSGNNYKGTFDGGGHKVSNLYINTESNYQDLFGYISGATISNFGVSGSVTTSYASGCSVGGVVGYATESSLTACYTSVSVDATGSDAYVGGIVGAAYKSSRITSCYSYGSVNSASSSNLGGVVGVNDDSTISYCYYDKGTVTATGATNTPSVAVGNTASDAGIVKGLTTAEMKGDDSTEAILLGYLQTGASGYWQADYTDNDSINNGYPILITPSNDE